jgi:hypothetical protein
MAQLVVMSARSAAIAEIQVEAPTLSGRPALSRKEGERSKKSTLERMDTAVPGCYALDRTAG